MASNALTKLPVFIPADTLKTTLTHKTLINHFESSLPTVSPIITAPPRQGHAVSQSSSLLLMPSWSSSPLFPYIGVKLITHFPENSALNTFPGVQGSYVLFNAQNGQNLASIDGTLLTLYRTACVSGLASKILARNDSKVMVMVGAGNLASHLVKAHKAARPNLEKVIIWNRTFAKAESLAEMLKGDEELRDVCFEANGCLDEVVGLGDIVSCATNSEVALVKGELLKSGAHLDLVGSFRPSMRECDDEALKRGRVFVDNDMAFEESGELVGAFERGVIKRDDVVGCLVELIKGDKDGRKRDDEITVFKAVGNAIVDILAAQLVYESFVKAKN